MLQWDSQICLWREATSFHIFQEASRPLCFLSTFQDASDDSGPIRTLLYPKGTLQTFLKPFGPFKTIQEPFWFFWTHYTSGHIKTLLRPFQTSQNSSRLVRTLPDPARPFKTHQDQPGPIKKLQDPFKTHQDPSEPFINLQILQDTSKQSRTLLDPSVLFLLSRPAVLCPSEFVSEIVLFIQIVFH